MKMQSVLIGVVAAASLLGGTTATRADDGASPHGRQVKFVRKLGPSVEHAAMQNIMAEALSAKTGRSVAEIKALFADSPPPEVARELGLSETDMKSLFKQSRETLIQRAAAAGLITAEQATELRNAKLPDRMRHGPGELPPPDDDEG